MLWDAISGARLRTLGETEGYVEGELEGVAFAPDGKTLFTGPRGWNSGFTIRRWDFSTGEQLQTLDGFTGGVRKFTFQPDGHTLASVSSNDMFYVWDWMRGESMQRKALEGEYNQYDISPDGKTLALIPWGDGSRIILWDAAGWKQLNAITPQGRYCPHNQIRLSNVLFSPDGSHLAVAACETITVWDVEGGKEVSRLQEAPEAINSIAFSADGKRIAAAEGIRLEEPDENGFNFLPGLLVWDMASGRVIKNWPGPDGNTLAYLPWGYLILWNMPDGNPRVVLPWEYAVKSVAFSPDGKRLAAGTAGGEVLLLDPATGELLKTLRGHTYNVEAVAFSADGKTLASGSDDGTIILWDMEY